MYTYIYENPSIINGSALSFTFGADVGAWDAHLDAVLFHLHLVAGTCSDAGVVVHHKIIWQQRDSR